MTVCVAVTTFSRKLRELRLARGWSQERLAAETDLAHRTITRLESGEERSPLRSTLRLLAHALDVTVDDLVGQDERAAS